MIKITSASNMDFEKAETKLEYEITNECPRCKTGIIPHEISAVVFSLEGHHFATVLNFCNKCKRCFMTTYEVTLLNQHELTDKIYVEFAALPADTGLSEPKAFQGTKFSQYISDLSPKFVEIYNQSESAETHRLTQISGMGYRKALEFLVKDYAINTNPNEKSKIESMLLSNCVNTYIDNPKIKTLAEKSAWLGNDETHYIKKHTDKDVSDLKKFINACANYIEMELTVEDANTITKA